MCHQGGGGDLGMLIYGCDEGTESPRKGPQKDVITKRKKRMEENYEEGEILREVK